MNLSRRYGAPHELVGPGGWRLGRISGLLRWWGQQCWEWGEHPSQGAEAKPLDDDDDLGGKRAEIAHLLS